MAGGSDRTQAASWWRAETGKVRCLLCPHTCLIPEDGQGLCRIRRNLSGSMTLPFHGRLSSIADDPIEKKPLHHFLPGSRILSAGFFGCNLRCPFCQNWQISQQVDPSASFVTPEDLIAAAVDRGIPSVAYTYSEPCMHFEYLMEAMATARQAGIKNVLVTNGCLQEGPARELLSLADAANVDLKTWSDITYSARLGGKLAAVKHFIELAAHSCHLEVTTLVVPGISDSANEMAGIVGFLADLDRGIPFHLSAYYPAWKYEEPPSPPSLLEEFAARAAEKLHHVYLGNLGGRGADTHCARCGALLVSRRGYSTRIVGLTEGNAQAGTVANCSSCGEPQRFVLH